MKLLLVLAAAVAAADILLLLPMGLHVRYAAGALSFAVLAGPVPVRRMQKAGKVRRAGGKSALGRIPPAVLIRTARRCRGRVQRLLGWARLDALQLHFTAGGDDPFRTAMAYARMGAAMEGIRRLASARRTDLRATADFSGGPTVLEGQLDVCVRLGTALAAAVCFGTALLREYFRYQRERE